MFLIPIIGTGHVVRAINEHAVEHVDHHLCPYGETVDHQGIHAGRHGLLTQYQISVGGLGYQSHVLFRLAILFGWSAFEHVPYRCGRNITLFINTLIGVSEENQPYPYASWTLFEQTRFSISSQKFWWPVVEGASVVADGLAYVAGSGIGIG